MSKSLGNVIDPLHVIEGCSFDTLESGVRNSNLSEKEKKRSLKLLRKEFPSGIEKCGTDALRLALASYLQQGNAINMNMNNVVAARKFGNKIWNSVKYIIQYCEQEKGSSSVENCRGSISSLPSQWILSRLHRLCVSSNEHLENFRFAAFAQGVQAFWVNEFCDVFLESTKSSAQPGEQLRVLLLCADATMRLLHPIMPFLSEMMFQRIASTRENVLGDRDGAARSILEEPFPLSERSELLRPDDALIVRNDAAEKQMDLVLAIVQRCRSSKATLAGVISPKDLKSLKILPGPNGGDAIAKVCAEQNDLLRTLCIVDSVSCVGSNHANNDGAFITGPGPNGTVFRIALPDYSEQVKQEVHAKIGKKIKGIAAKKKKLHRQVKSIEAKMAVSGYHDNTPIDIKSRDEDMIAQRRAEIASGDESAESLSLLQSRL